MRKSAVTAGLIMATFCSLLLLPLSIHAKESVSDGSIDNTQLASAIEAYVSDNNPNNAAVSVSIVDDKQVLYEGCFGYINKEQNIPADQDTIYEWGSLTKVLTWISVMQLVEQGRMDLNTDICTYLPNGFLKKVKFDTPVTILDLMNHTGGWEDSITNVYTDKSENILPLAEFITRYEPNQLYEPGTTVAYSNWSTSLAGYIVERVSGEDYCDYIINHIYKPLGMDQTSIYPLHDENAFVKRGMEHNTGYTTGGKEFAGRYYAPDYPAASAAGTIKDVQLLMQALLTDTENPLFQQDQTLRTMLETTNYFAGTDQPEIAHGLWYNFYKIPTLGHSGNTPQFSVQMSLAPSEKLGMITMTNIAQEMALTYRLGEVVFGENTDGLDGTYRPLTFQKNYVCARTIESGYCRFYHFFLTFHVKTTGENTILLASPFKDVPCTRIGEQEYYANDGLFKGYHFYIEESDGVVQKISTSTFDLIPCSSGKVILETASFLIMGLVLIVVIILCILCIIKMCKQKQKYGITLLMNLLSISVFAGIFMEAEKLMTTAASTKDMIPYVLFFVLYLLCGLGYIVYFIKTKLKSKIKIVSLVTVTYIMAFILYWQMIFM